MPSKIIRPSLELTPELERWRRWMDSKIQEAREREMTHAKSGFEAAKKAINDLFAEFVAFDRQKAVDELKALLDEKVPHDAPNLDIAEGFEQVRKDIVKLVDTVLAKTKSSGGALQGVAATQLGHNVAADLRETGKVLTEQYKRLYAHADIRYWDGPELDKSSGNVTAENVKKAEDAAEKVLNPAPQLFDLFSKPRGTYVLTLEGVRALQRLLHPPEPLLYPAGSELSKLLEGKKAVIKAFEEARRRYSGYPTEAKQETVNLLESLAKAFE